MTSAPHLDIRIVRFWAIRIRESEGKKTRRKQMLVHVSVKSTNVVIPQMRLNSDQPVSASQSFVLKDSPPFQLHTLEQLASTTAQPIKRAGPVIKRLVIND